MRAKIQIFALWLVSLMTLTIFAPVPAQAACVDTADRTIFGPAGYGIPSWDEYLRHDPDKGYAVCEFDFPFDLVLVLLALVEMLVRLAGYVAVGVIIYGGFKFMTSRGSPEGIVEAKKILEQAIIGLVIALLATAIISFFAGRFN